MREDLATTVLSNIESHFSAESAGMKRKTRREKWFVLPGATHSWDNLSQPDRGYIYSERVTPEATAKILKFLACSRQWQQRCLTSRTTRAHGKCGRSSRPGPILSMPAAFGIPLFSLEGQGMHLKSAIALVAWAGLAGLGGMLGGCATWSSPEATVRTYESARISIPRVVADGVEVVAGYNGRVRDDPAQAQLQALVVRGLRMPTVLYMHGCVGLGLSSLLDLAQISAAGAIAYAPDSYARPDRPLACDETRYTHGGLGMWLLRFDEAAYARERLAAEPWIDNERIAMMGFSEGGFTVALSRDPRYVGYVVTGANCVGYNNQNGLSIPRDKPVLVILSRFDPWFSTTEVCTASLAGRPNSRSVILDRPGHYMNSEPEAREALRSFLNTTLRLK